jgi:hypothetical protein
MLNRVLRMAQKTSLAIALTVPLLAFQALHAAPAAEDGRVQKPVPLIELRQYVLYPGKREAFTRLFEDQFIESQEAVGLYIIGTFHEPVHPSHFTWIRGFTDMDARAKGLDAFYSGPVWQAHRNTANPMLEDNDNVLLLREAYPGSGFPIPNQPRPPIGSTTLPGGLVVVNIYYLREPPRTRFTEFFKETMTPQLKKAGIGVLAALVPEESPNNFPKLRIREGENLFVWFARFNDTADYQHHWAALAAQPQWRDHVAAAWTAQLNSPPEILELEPTARSLLH